MRAEGPGGSAKRLAAFFVALDKTIRGSRMYEGRGEVVDRLTESMMQKADAALEGGEVTVRVASFGLVLGSEPVTPTDERIAYLFQLYCDGLRELTFMPGLDREEVLAFARVLVAEGTDDDIVTRLWAAQFPHIRHYAVDRFAAGDEGEAEVAGLSRARGGAQIEGSAAGAGEEVALSAADVRVLQKDDALPWVLEATAPARATGAIATVAEGIRKSFSTPMDHGRFVQLALRVVDDDEDALVLDLFDSLVRNGDVDGLIVVLKTLAGGAQRGDEACRRLLKGVVSAERLPTLAPIYVEAPERLQPYLRALADIAQPGLVALLNELQAPEARAGLHDMLAEVGVDLTSFHVRRLAHDDDEIVKEAAAALGAIATADALKALSGALSSSLTSVRRAALEAMAGSYHDSARIALGRALRDPDAENRLLALSIVRGSGDGRFAWQLVGAVTDASFGAKDTAEQTGLYEALAAFKDDRTLGHFRSVLSEKNITRSKAVVRRQEMVVDALASVGSDAARKVLDEAGSHWYLAASVRSSIAKALSAWGKGS